MELHNNRLNNEQNRIQDLERAQRAPKTPVEATVDRVLDARTEQQRQVEGLTQRNRDQTDSIDLSATARLFTGETGSAERGALVDSLKAAYDSGSLNTRERIERAAHNLLAID